LPKVSLDISRKALTWFGMSLFDMYYLTYDLQLQVFRKNKLILLVIHITYVSYLHTSMMPYLMWKKSFLEHKEIGRCDWLITDRTMSNKVQSKYRILLRRLGKRKLQNNHVTLRWLLNSWFKYSTPRSYRRRFILFLSCLFLHFIPQTFQLVLTYSSLIS
jgi:hypothetical protein